MLILLLCHSHGYPLCSNAPVLRAPELSEVKLLVPVIPPTFYAGGLNYPEHVKWWAQYSGLKLRPLTEPGIGYRTINAVIGKQARNLTPENALSCVLGYTIGNDVSQRTWQIQDGSLWRAKNADTFKPMGPWIATDLDPNNLETTVRINGQVQIQFNTRHMLFNAASHIAKISRYSTLYPGDVVGWGRRARPRTCGRG